MSTLRIRVAHNGVCLPCAEFEFDRAYAIDDSVVIVDVDHDSGDSEGFCLSFAATKALHKALRAIVKHPAIRGSK